MWFVLEQGYRLRFRSEQNTIHGVPIRSTVRMDIVVEVDKHARLGNEHWRKWTFLEIHLF